MSVDPEEIALAESSLGQEAEFFKDSAVGQLIIGKAAQDEDAATQALLEINPYGYDTLEALQTALNGLQANVKVAQRIIGYIMETIEAGRQADEALGELERQEDG